MAKENILIIDGQGGGIGRQLVSEIKEKLPDCTVTAAGADNAATGENAVKVGCRHADVISGPVGIVIADSLFGEITPAMAVSVGQSNAKRVLIPVNHCDNIVVGVNDLTVGRLVDAAVAEIGRICGE